MKKSFGTLYFTITCTIICICSSFALAVTPALAFTGSITTGFSQALVCHDGPCTPGAAGKLNWKPTLASGIAAVAIDDTTGLTGNIFGNELGWINLHPTVASPATINPTTGAISGFAYSGVCGYINFAPTSGGVSVVTITQQTNGTGGVGQLSGYAWCGGTNGGWIQFDCSVGGNAACVQTNWVKLSDRVTVTPPSSGGGGGGGGGGVVSDTSGSAATTNQFQNDNQYLNQTGPQSQKTDFTNEYRADIDDSGIVDILDYNSLMVFWGKTSSNFNNKLIKQDRCKASNTIAADVNCDGTVDILDFNIVMIYWGKKIGSPVKN